MTEPASTKLRKVAANRTVAAEAKRSLQELAAALESGDHLEGWAAVDLRAAFDQETALKVPAVAVWLGRCLDVLVFVPIATTWLGLTAATIAYRETVNDPALSGQSFLQRWQTGFNGHIWAGLSFDRVSEITFIFVAIIVALAVAHFGFRLRAEHGGQARAHRLLSEALTMAERELAPVRLGAVGRVAAEVGEVATQVAATTDEVRKVGEAAERAQDAAGTAIDRIAVAMAAVQAAAADVAQAVMDMGEKLADATAATSAVADTEAEFGEKLLDATDKLDTTVAGLADRLSAAIGSGENRLVESMNRSSAAVAGSLSEGARQVRSAIGELNAAAATNAREVGTAVTSLEREVRETNAPVPGLLRRLNTELTRLSDGIERLVASMGKAKARAEARAAAPARPSRTGVPVAVPVPRDRLDGSTRAEPPRPTERDDRRWWQRWRPW